jgi:predicted transcriptional regulator
MPGCLICEIGFVHRYDPSLGWRDSLKGLVQVIGVFINVVYANHPDPLAIPFQRYRLIAQDLKTIVHFTPEQEAQLSQIATKAGTDAERLVKDAALRLLQEDAGFRAAVREGIAQADLGELIGEEEMDARLEQMLRS